MKIYNEICNTETIYKSNQKRYILNQGYEAQTMKIHPSTAKRIILTRISPNRCQGLLKLHFDKHHYKSSILCRVCSINVEYVVVLVQVNADQERFACFTQWRHVSDNSGIKYGVPVLDR